jgi:hypothetical protein
MNQHIPNVNCPHCNNAEHSTIAEITYLWDNGSRKSTDYRCEFCGAKWRVNRQFLFTDLLERGWTPSERKAEILNFVAIQNQLIELSRANVPDDYYRFVNTRV